MLHELGDQPRARSTPSLKTSSPPVRNRRLTRESPSGTTPAPYGEGATYTPPPANPRLPQSRSPCNLSRRSRQRQPSPWTRLDADHGNVVKAFDAMGRPAAPSRQARSSELRAAAHGPHAPEQTMRLHRRRASPSPFPRRALVLLKLHSRMRHATLGILKQQHASRIVRLPHSGRPASEGGMESNVRLTPRKR